MATPLRDNDLSMTPELTGALEATRLVAVETRSEYVRPLHLLVGTLAAEGSRARQILSAMRIDPAEIVQRARTAVGVGRHLRPDPWSIPYDRATLQTLKDALNEARKAGRPAVGTEHVLLALLRAPRHRWIGMVTERSARRAREVLSQSRITAEMVREQVSSDGAA